MQINALELAHRARVDGDISEGQELKSKYRKLSTEVKDITERGLQKVHINTVENHLLMEV
jgi:hypothetical protein